MGGYIAPLDWELAQDGLTTIKKLLQQLDRPHDDGH
jgi:hypothetical protein